MIVPQGKVISGDAGHNCIPDVGASGIKQEDQLTKEVWKLVQYKLKNLGYSIVDCTPWNMNFKSVSGSLSYRVNVANESSSILHLCIHFNAGGGNGVECWVIPGGDAEQYGKQICVEISKSLGLSNRGVKNGSGLYVPKYTKMSCVLIECSFVDSAYDMKQYSGEIMAQAIIKAITNNESESIDILDKPNNISPSIDNSINANAEVINDWFYVRDSEGNVIEGRVDIGDKIQVIDISYSKQLALVKYPTANGRRTEYIKNVPQNIRYFYQYQWQNGSTEEIVYQDSGCTQSIGSLNTWEKATPLYRENGILQIAYDTNLGINTKSGFVKYNGGFNRF